MTIIYIHGFRSDEGNNKSKILKEIFPDFEILTASFKPNAEKQIEELFKSVERYPVLFVGTSLGALYAMHSGIKFNCKVLAINPSIKPFETISEGNYKTYNRVLDYVVDDTVINEWKKVSDMVVKYQVQSETFHTSLIHVVMNEDDEVLDFAELRRISPFFTNYSSGGHRARNFKKIILDYIEMGRT